MNIKSALLTLAAALALSSCNTISGIGKDVEAMGSKIDSHQQVHAIRPGKCRTLL